MSTSEDEGPVPTIDEAREAANHLLRYFGERPLLMAALRQKVGARDFAYCMQVLRAGADMENIEELKRQVETLWEKHNAH